MLNVRNLKTIRERRIMTQRELAEAAKVSPSTVALLEQGKAEAQPRTVRKLAKALGVEPQELVGE